MKSLFPNFPARMREFASKLPQPSWSFLMLPMLCGTLHGATVDLAVTITAPIDRVSVKSNLVYSVGVTNLSSHTATGVRVTNELDPNLSFVSATTSQGSCAHSAGLVVCNVGNLGSGGTVTVTIRTQPAVQGEYVTTATVGASQQDENPDDNIISAWTQVGLANLAVGISNPSEPIIGGQIVTYEFSITNRGPDSTDVVFGAYVPSLVPDKNELISYSVSTGVVDASTSSYIYWSVPTLQPGGVATAEFAFRIAFAETFWIEGAVSPPDVNADPDWSNNRFADGTQVIGGPGILQFSLASISALESEGVARINVERLGGSAGTVAVNIGTLNGTAIAGVDYVATNALLTFTNGEAQKSFPVFLIRDTSAQCAREFSIQLSSVSGGAFLKTKTNVVVTVFDADVTPRGVTECVTVTYSNSLVVAAGENFYSTGLSKDGRFALFGGNGPNLVEGDSTGFLSVYLRDLEAKTTRLVTVNQAGTQGANGHSVSTALSANGRRVAFASVATDLTTNLVAGEADIFVRDVITETTTLVSVSTNGTAGGNGPSYEPLISSNGLMVAFWSVASDLVPDCHCEGAENIFARDLVSGTTHLVTVSASGVEPINSTPMLRGLSATGRFVLFMSTASNLVSGDTNEVEDLFVRDLQTKTTLLVSANRFGTGTGNGSIIDYPPQISPDGRFVLFSSEASDLVLNDGNERGDVFIRDLVLGTTRLVSANWFGNGSANGYSGDPFMTPDGRFIAFVSEANDLVGVAPHRPWNVFLRDMQLGVTTLVSVNCSGGDAGNSGQPNLSDDGRYVAFLSRALDLVPGNFSYPSWELPKLNVYRRDIQAGTTVLLSANYALTGGSSVDCGELKMSGDGKVVQFVSGSIDLSISQDEILGPGVGKVYVWRELPSGLNTELRVTSQVEHRQSVMVISLAVTNYGPDSATGVVVRDTLPAGAQFLTAGATAGSCIVSSGEVTCTIGNLPRRGGAIITLVATPTTDGVVSHVASVTGGDPDPLFLNNTAIASAALMLPPSGALSIANIGDLNFVTWLSMPPSFQLERASTLASPADWSAISTGILDNGIMKTLIVTNGFPAHGYYRLHSQ